MDCAVRRCVVRLDHARVRTLAPMTFMVLLMQLLITNHHTLLVCEFHCVCFLLRSRQEIRYGNGQCTKFDLCMPRLTKFTLAELGDSKALLLHPTPRLPNY